MKKNNRIIKKIASYYPINSKKERILLIGHSGDRGGAEILLKNMIHEFKKQDVEVVVIVKGKGPMIKIYKELAPTFVIKSDKKFEGVIEELKNQGFQNAILNTILTGNFIPLLKKYNFYTISLVHELPGVIKLCNAENISNIIAESANLVIFPSEFVGKHFEEMFDIKNSKLILPQGLYNSYNDFNKELSRSKLEKKYNIPKNNHIILNVGYGSTIKGFDLFCEVADNLKNENLTFIWVGSIEKSLKRKCKSLINNNDNLILTGYINDQNELMTYYDACDIFMLTSREDSFPSVVLESFNAKTPVVGFENAGGFQDIVINDVSGYLVKYGSTNELAKKVKFLASNDNLINTLGNNGKKICDQYDFKSYVNILKMKSIDGKHEIQKNKMQTLKKETSISERNKPFIEKNNVFSLSYWKQFNPLNKLK